VSGLAVTWVDGVLAKSLSLPDRGLDFGDGLFETVLVVHGQPVYFSLHLQRLERGLLALKFPNCISLVKTQVASILSSRSFNRLVAIRVTITRGEGPRGYAPPAVSTPRIIITCVNLPDDQYKKIALPARVSRAEIRWGCQPALAGLKHLNRLEQVMAAAEKAKAGVDEVVMLGQDGSIISVSSGNIFLYADGTLITPDLSECGVCGTRRELILSSLAPALGLSTRVERVSEALLEKADEVFYCNALVGMRPVAHYAGRTWQRHGVSEALHELYWERAQ
jgi:4-amino-4-deoxychorismate lyase